jgi:2-polyprenyl-3-methyl-5-hydroxy-6-metoxy-1,4-benzoquinol methylase
MLLTGEGRVKRRRGKVVEWSCGPVVQSSVIRQSAIVIRRFRRGCEFGRRLIICSGVQTQHNQNNGCEFREDVKRIWDEFQRLEKSREFGNLEGGSVEQQRDRRLQLHHCANYAAVLAVLKGSGHDPESSADSGHVPMRLLEFGCGSGVLTSAMAQVMPDGWTMEATDYSEHLLASARERFARQGLSFSHLDVRTIKPERLEGVDAVLLLEVIEHLPADEAEALLRQVYGALPSGGMMVMTTLDRAAFPRPFSGYAPHFVEYTYSSLDSFLGDRRRSPFEAHNVFRLVSERIVSESIRAEERGGYLVNRLQRLMLTLGRRHAEFGAFRGWAESRVFHLYSFLPDRDGFDFDGYLASLDFDRSQPELRDHDSFGLVAVLRKSGEGRDRNV